MGNNPSYFARKAGTTGWEIVGPDGTVIAWTTDGYWATLIVALIIKAGQEGLSCGGSAHPASPARQ
jgi:hypothetical protein